MVLDTNVQNLAVRVATQDKLILTLLSGNVENLSGLNTTTKTNLVAAINEVLATAGGSASINDLTDVVITTPANGEALIYNGSNWVNSELPEAAEPASETVAGIVELATTGETTTGTDTVRAVTPAGVAAAIGALVDSAPGTLNTLNELAAALADDPNFATTITDALAGKQPLDTDLTAIAALTSAANKLAYATGAGTWALADLTVFARSLLDDSDAATARTTLDVWSKAEVGPVTTNYVTLFETGLV